MLTSDTDTSAAQPISRPHSDLARESGAIVENVSPQGQRLCHASDVAEGEARGVGPLEGTRRKVILIRRNGVLRAWLDACPHYTTGTPMAWKTDAYLNGEGTHLTCHSHNALFEIDTGECILGPCLGQRLTRIDIAVSEQGDVFVVPPREGGAA